MRGAGQDLDQTGGQVGQWDKETKDNEVFSRSWIDFVCRNCVDALRYLGEAGKCRKLDSQVTKVQLFVF